MGIKKPILQFAALPYLVEDGHPLVMLVTSRETKRWIIPKGKPEKGLRPPKAAAREAWEEAGVKGTVATRPFRTFRSVKRMPDGRELPALVKVFLLAVTGVAEDWPEKGQRERRLASPGQAALLCSDEGLVQVLLDFGTLWS